MVTLLGDHDIATSHEVRRALADVRQVPLTVVELGDCTFVDSTVLGVLVGASRRAAEAGGRLVAVNASGIVARALELTGVDDLLHVTDDPLAAERIGLTGRTDD